MIITRSPLRITLGGGGTDLPSYYSEHSGFLISAAIDKYVYITLHKIFVPGFIIKYSKMEKVQKVDEIAHTIIKEAIRMTGAEDGYLEIASMADIPEGTGLGSSGSFTTALLKALHTYKKALIHPKELAEQACSIELDRLKKPIGKQDQYIAAYGGITSFRFHPDGRVDAWPVKMTSETLYNLEDNLMLFFTGYSREAADILKTQDFMSKENDKDMIANLHHVKELGKRSLVALEKGDLIEFAKIMDEHWCHKKQRPGGISNPKIDEWYELAMKNGALGGKLIGAGGGGFLIFYAQDKVALRNAMNRAGLQEVRFRFDFEGTKIVL